MNEEINEAEMIPIVRTTIEAPAADVHAFFTRPPVEQKADQVAREMLANIRQHGDTAVLGYAKDIDGAELTAEMLAVTSAERAEVRDLVSNEFKNAAREVLRRVTRFAQAGLRKDWTISSPRGGVLGEQFVPLDRIGAYIPAGTAPLASTAMMTCALAKAAGVPEIVACTPAKENGRIDPHLIFALELAGATEVYKIGGIQSIGAMAYGTDTIAKVQKIVGPGGPYVTAAKRIVYGDVGLDMVAGPSEIAILADESANPVFIAADLLSQAEHGSGSEKVLLVTTSDKMANDVRKEMLKQTRKLSRSETIYRVLTNGTLVLVVDMLDEGMELINQFAPEHFELMVKEPMRWVKKVRAAGAVFVGSWTPECAGDFVAGPSHVLPTGGTAAIFSGLTVEDFRRRTSIISYTRADLHDALPLIQAFGDVEGLDGHTRSATIRFDS